MEDERVFRVAECLVLQHADDMDSGRWVCLVNNSAGVERVDFNLQVSFTFDYMYRQLRFGKPCWAIGSVNYVDHFRTEVFGLAYNYVVAFIGPLNCFGHAIKMKESDLPHT